MAPSQRSAENFNKKLAAKAKRGIVSTGASSNKGTVDPKSLKPKELPCPHCDRLFKQQDRLKQHVAKHHASEVAEAATEAAKETPKVENTAADKAGSSSSSKKKPSSGSGMASPKPPCSGRRRRTRRLYCLSTFRRSATSGSLNTP